MSEHTSEKKNNSYYSSNNNRGHSYRGSSRGHPYRGGSRGYPQHSHRGPPPRNYNRNYHDDSKHNSRPFKNTVPSPDGDLRQSLPNRGTNSTINYASYNQPYQKRVIDLNPPNVEKTLEDGQDTNISFKIDNDRFKENPPLIPTTNDKVQILQESLISVLPKEPAQSPLSEKPSNADDVEIIEEVKKDKEDEFCYYSEDEEESIKESNSS